MGYVYVGLPKNEVALHSETSLGFSGPDAYLAGFAKSAPTNAARTHASRFVFVFVILQITRGTLDPGGLLKPGDVKLVVVSSELLKMPFLRCSQR